MRRFYNRMVQLSVSNLTKGWWDTTQLSIKEFLHLASIMRNSIHHTQGTILVRSDQRPIPHQKLWQPDGSGRPFKELKEKKKLRTKKFQQRYASKMKEKGLIVTCDPDYVRSTIRAHHVGMHVSLYVQKGKTCCEPNCLGHRIQSDWQVSNSFTTFC